jgi:heme/copper-type cytochrome/quinol oxidase subunit 4
LVFPIYLYLKNKEENADKKYTSEGENKNINSQSKNRSIKDRLYEIFQIIFLISFLCAYFFVSGALFVSSYIQCYLSLCKIPIPFWLAIVLFIIIQLSIIIAIIFFLFFKLKEDKQRNIALLLFSIIIVIAIILSNPRFFLIAPFYVLKLGQFEANLTLDKEYVEKSGLKTYLEKCQPECSDESSEDTQNDNYCRIFKFFVTCSEKCQTECLDELLFKDTQNYDHCRTFKFFIFLRTDSEYIVGCSKNPNVRIHIPSDKVIAIEYIEEDSKKEENKNTPTPQQQTPQQQNK